MQVRASFFCHDLFPLQTIRPMTPAAPRRLDGLRSLFVLLLSLTLGLSGTADPASGQSTGDPAATVSITNSLNFEPDTVRIERGQTVRWKNTSVIVHTVTADPTEATIDGSVKLPDGASRFDSGTLDPKATFEHQFETPGTYRYFCIPHEGTKMYGAVIVEPAGG